MQVYSHSNSYQEADLSTPYESVMGIEDKSLSESSSQKPQSLYHLELTPDNYWLADCLGPTWLSDVTNLVLRDLNTYGFCAVDHFLGKFLLLVLIGLLKPFTHTTLSYLLIFIFMLNGIIKVKHLLIQSLDNLHMRY